MSEFRFGRMKLMIVDDHAETRRLIRELVGHLAREVRECANGHEAIRQCREFRPDFVTMDLNMEPMDGFEATRRIVETHASTRIIIVTHSNIAELGPAALRAGARCLVAKSNLATLPRRLKGWLNEDAANGASQ